MLSLNWDSYKKTPFPLSLSLSPSYWNGHWILDNLNNTMDQDHYQHLVQHIKYQVFPDNSTDKEQRKIQGQSLKFLVKNEILYKRNKTDPDQPLRVVKEGEVTSLLKRIHEDPVSGHFGIHNTFNRAAQRYFWPQMFDDVKKHIQHCDICQKHKKANTVEGLYPLPVGKPFDRVGIDLV